MKNEISFGTIDRTLKRIEAELANIGDRYLNKDDVEIDHWKSLYQEIKTIYEGPLQVNPLDFMLVSGTIESYAFENGKLAKAQRFLRVVGKEDDPRAEEQELVREQTPIVGDAESDLLALMQQYIPVFQRRQRIRNYLEQFNERVGFSRWL